MGAHVLESCHDAFAGDGEASGTCASYRGLGVDGDHVCPAGGKEVWEVAQRGGGPAQGLLCSRRIRAEVGSCWSVAARSRARRRCRSGCPPTPPTTATRWPPRSTQSPTPTAALRIEAAAPKNRILGNTGSVEVTIQLPAGSRVEVRPPPPNSGVWFTPGGARRRATPCHLPPVPCALRPGRPQRFDQCHQLVVHDSGRVSHPLERPSRHNSHAVPERPTHVL